LYTYALYCIYMEFSFEKIFPVPDMLRMPAIGFDISDTHIRYVELVRKYNGVHMGRYGTHKIPEGIITEGSIQDVDALASVVGELQKKLDIRLVRASLPEKKVYLFDVSIPKISENKIPEAILYQIEEHIPLKKSELVFDYEVLSEDDRTYHVQIHAIEKNVAMSYTEALSKGGCAPLSFELEPQAVTRALECSQAPHQFMLVDIGETHTSISIIRSSIVVFTTTVLLDLLGMTKDIEACVAQFPETNVEDRLSDECVKEMEQYIQPLGEHIKKYYNYWQAHIGSETLGVEKILLSGVGAHARGMTEYINGLTRLEVMQAPIWSVPNKIGGRMAMSQNELIDYSVAIGLVRTDFFYD